MSWTDERIATLRKLWGEGLTASQIADVFGDVTRNAVIGKVHRLGLKSRTKVTRKTANNATNNANVNDNHIQPESPQNADVNSTVKNGASEAGKAETVAVSNSNVKMSSMMGNTALKMEEEVEAKGYYQANANEDNVVSMPSHQRAHILQLNEHRCKWPIGDPMQDDFYYCGNTKEAGKSYCEDHCKIAYQQPTRKIDNKAS